MDKNRVVFPELFFGLVAPVGVDLDLAYSLARSALNQLGYKVELVKVTDAIPELFPNTPKSFNSLSERYKFFIEKANFVRSKSKDDSMMAMLTLSAIRQLREQTSNNNEQNKYKGTAYVIRQIKRVEEVELFRQVYGKQFYQISLYADTSSRVTRLARQMRDYEKTQSRSGQFHIPAQRLMQDDEYQEYEASGQRLRDVFPLGDVFIDVSNRKTAKETIDRFFKIIFGYNFHSPTRAEYGMYAAKAASLRSVDLSRQVGAAIFSKEGEILVQGCNEVPSRLGGTYWEGDEGDSREFQIGYDANEEIKLRLLSDVLEKFGDAEIINPKYKGMSAEELFDVVKKEKEIDLKKRMKMMDIIEYGRIVHAEMNAVTDAARKGVALKRSILYCTTFPCHICTKHIIASGIKKVVYLEPYPKSFAEELYSDEIIVGRGDVSESEKVIFEPFIGIAPYRYRDFFEKTRRKDKKGKAKEWVSEGPAPLLRVTALDVLNYIKTENEYVAYGAKILVQQNVVSASETRKTSKKDRASKKPRT